MAGMELVDLLNCGCCARSWHVQRSVLDAIRYRLCNAQIELREQLPTVVWKGCVAVTCCSRGAVLWRAAPCLANTVT